MVGIILVSHGKLAQEFRHAAEHVVGPQDKFMTISIEPEDDIDKRRQDLLEAIQQTATERGAIILTDMFGGTPSNLAISVMDTPTIEVIAGINLPLLIKLISLRQCSKYSMHEILLAAQEAGRKYLTIPSIILHEQNS